MLESKKKAVLKTNKAVLKADFLFIETFILLLFELLSDEFLVTCYWHKSCIMQKLLGLFEKCVQLYRDKIRKSFFPEFHVNMYSMMFVKLYDVYFNI